MKKKLERERRLNICRACEKFEPVLTRCKECGCFLKLKTWFMNSNCPLGKWEQQFDVLEYLSMIQNNINQEKRINNNNNSL